jgi:phosphatidylinositol dimannoside acyltransferase
VTADRPTEASASKGRRLEAPHRRGGESPRIVERLAVAGYRANTWLLSTVPARIAVPVMGRLSQASYLLWPTKRRWSNQNYGHVLGLPPSDPRVRTLALQAYREYGRYLVEIMRLPSMKPDAIADLVPDMDAEGIREIWRAAPGGGLIFAVGHVGNNDAVAAAIARHQLPISVVADDSSFPEIFEILRQQRESWGVHVVAWRNLRGIFSVLRNREMLALLVDWGYRSDGIPVQLFGSWTTLPAGPATLAAKTGSRILPVTIRRKPDGRFLLTWPSGPVDVASNDPAELQRATQALADALGATIGAAPAQWYNFKPIWPDSPEEADDLAGRAAIMQAGRPDPGPARAFR